ncbi:hypothetical protein ACIBG8_28910 [Nonomuraea sp. NPDC050556]|uniref:hypothetical protein n=1 Tax=Nonomuraea sp. NPDC050556 TaxID=3364369 RepID=UPI0037895C26
MEFHPASDMTTSPQEFPYGENMFFEPPPVQEESTPPPKPGLPVWSAPPAEEMGAVMVGGMTLARTPNVAITLPTIHAFSTGCLINVDIVTRRQTLSTDDFQALQLSVFPHMITGVRADQPLPDQLLRFGVRFADGAKATTVGQRLDRAQLPQDPPPGPQLSLLLPGMSMRSGDEDAGVMTMGLWLWPSPPRESFELAVEWPVGGIQLSIVELDGAAIAAAAQQAVPYWPESPLGA